ncbi:hypothetical protein L7F22_025377 [Adiantum nelumboides]|nr:hypothetical protein [Adiantum nelumboides]
MVDHQVRSQQQQEILRASLVRREQCGAVTIQSLRASLVTAAFALSRQGMPRVHRVCWRSLMARLVTAALALSAKGKECQGSVESAVELEGKLGEARAVQGWHNREVEGKLGEARAMQGPMILGLGNERAEQEAERCPCRTLKHVEDRRPQEMLLSESAGNPG